MSRKIIITGATGLIGTRLCKELKNRGDVITVFTRNVVSAKQLLGNDYYFVKWNYENPSKWQDSLNDHDAVIHLAGANLSGKRWTNKYKKIIRNSRVLGTKSLVSALSKNNSKIKVLINSSAVGYYGSRGDEILIEESTPTNDFLAKVCAEWENEAQHARELGIRTVVLRQGVVLSDKGGALKKFLLPFKLFVGGPLGNGNQWFPWIHIDDLVEIYLFILDYSQVSGAINAVSPENVRMNEFAKTLGKTLNRPSIFKVPEFALRILVGEVTSSIVASQKVIPQKLLGHDFKFKFENLEIALKNLVRS